MSVLGPSNLEFLPILRPTLPSSSELNPFLLRIDKTSQYSNFGPLLEEFEERLSGYYENRFNERAGCVVVAVEPVDLYLQYKNWTCLNTVEF